VLLLIGTPISMMGAYNRLGEMKQDYFFSFIANVMVGIGLTLIIATAPMVLTAIQNVVIYVLISGVGLALSFKKTENLDKAQPKFISTSLWVTISAVIMGGLIFGVAG